MQVHHDVAECVTSHNNMAECVLWEVFELTGVCCMQPAFDVRLATDHPGMNAACICYTIHFRD